MLETIVIIDGHAKQLDAMTQTIESKLRYRPLPFSNTASFIDWLASQPQILPELILADVPNQSDMSLVKEKLPNVPVIALIPHGEDGLFAKMFAAGVDDVLTLPTTVEHLHMRLKNQFKLSRLQRYAAWLQRRIAGHVEFRDLVGNDSEFQAAVAEARRRTMDTHPVWIEGEAGVGKEILARAIHGESSRAGQPFVVMDSRMIPPDAADAMIFGQEKSAHGEMNFFALGKIREADQGTLLVDYPEALPEQTRRKLQDVMRSGAFMPVGGGRAMAVNVRFIISETTNSPRDNMLAPEAWGGMKRQPIFLPPLRERQSDIIPLASHFLVMHAAAENRYIHKFTPEAKQWIQSSQWPGNVRQLSHAIWKAVICCERDMIEVAHMEAAQLLPAGRSQDFLPPLTDGRGRVKTLKSVQEEAIRYALEQSGGCMAKAARTLGIGRSTLYRKISQLNLVDQSSRENQTMRPTMTMSSIKRS